MEKSPSWSRAHDWKSCRPLKGLEGSNPSFSATESLGTVRFQGFSFLRPASVFAAGKPLGGTKERHLLLADVFLFGFISRRIQPDELKLYSWYAKSFPLTVLSLLSQLICRSGAVRIPTAPENLPPILCQSVISDRSGSSSDSLAVPGPCGSRGRPASEARQESPAQPLFPGPAPRFYLPRPRYASGGR